MSTDKLYKTDGFRFTPLKCFDNFRHSHVRALGLVGLAALFDGLFQDDVLDLHQSDRVGTLVFIELHRDILDVLLHLRNFDVFERVDAPSRALDLGGEQLRGLLDLGKAEQVGQNVAELAHRVVELAARLAKPYG